MGLSHNDDGSLGVSLEDGECLEPELLLETSGSVSASSPDHSFV